MTTYVCPMHPNEKSKKPGRCQVCGMRLVLPRDVPIYEDGLEKVTWRNYLPLLVILSLLFLGSLVATYPNFDLEGVVHAFMFGFFIVFALFKLADLQGFAQGYSTYDLLAKRWFGYGYLYPFIELAFGLLMLFSLFETQVLIVEIFVMVFSGVGVYLKLARGEKFQCVCLGTFLKIPLTRVTLIEDFGMAALALLLLFV